jgi:nucleotide-binding universal stress UspA family protein
MQRVGADRLALVREQVREAAGDGAEWPIDLKVGAPASYIAYEATARDAGLVVTGLRAHSALDRILRGETTLQVMRHVDVPVLAVLPTLKKLPRRIVVAVDFSRSSLRAARVATRLLDDGGTLFLVYVQPRMDREREDAEGLAAVYAQGVAGAFARLRGELRLPTNATVETVLLEGDAIPELLAFSERCGADLVAVGSHRHSAIDRWVLGSVTSALVRAARWSVLATPPRVGGRTAPG